MRASFSIGDVRLMLLSGLFLGLVAAEMPWRLASPEGTVGRAASSGPFRVIDGDTFDYGGARIRIADIDTPEIRGRCASEVALAERATDRLAILLAAGPLELRPVDRDTDIYGRKLRIVVRDDRSLGDQLVAEGLARRWDGARRPWCA